MQCSSRNCPQPRAEGSRFCEEHRELFAALRAEIDEGARARLRSPERERKRRRTMYKECDEAGCTECALPREAYCEWHLEQIARRSAQAGPA